MKYIKHRKIIIITGSDTSGKSKLGHLLASHNNFLYSFSTIPYHKYFDKKNFKIHENKIEKLKGKLKRLFYFQGGGFDKYGKKWLKSEKLNYYNFKKIENLLLPKIKKNLSIDDFYNFWNEALVKGRKNGSKTLYTIFEIENVFELNVINHFKKSKHNFKIVDIYRDPYEQIKELKIHTLFRGGPTNFKKGIYGSFNSIFNIFKIYLNEIINHYIFIRTNHKILHLKLQSLKPINKQTAEIISNYISDKTQKKFTNFLIKNSKLNNYKNKYINFKFTNQTSANLKTQAKFKLNKLIDNKNIENYMHTFEKKFYLDIKSILTNRKKYINIYELLSYCILGFIFGIKDIRQNIPFLRAITNRLNFLSIILSSYKLLSLYKNIQNEKKRNK